MESEIILNKGNDLFVLTETWTQSSIVKKYATLAGKTAIS